MLNSIKSLFSNKTIKAGSWYTITNFLIKGVNFLTIPIFTALLMPSEYGIVNIYLSWVSIFSIFISFDLQTTVGRAKVDFKDEYDKFNSSIMILSLILFSGFLLVFILFEGLFLDFTGLTRFLFYLMILHSYVYFLQQYIINKYRFDYNYKGVSIINVILTGVGIGLSIVFILSVFSDSPVVGKVLGQFLPIIAVAAYALIYLIKKGRTYYNKVYWQYALLLGIPLVFHSLSGVVNNQFDRVLIDRYVGSAEAGIYSFSYNIGNVILILSTSFNQAWVPWFYENMEIKGNRFLIRKYATYYRDMFTVLYAAILLFSPEVMLIMAGDESYLSGINLIPWILMAYYFQFMYTFDLQTEIVHKRTSLISIASIGSAALNVILNFIFIPIYGTLAAAISTVVSFFALFLAHYLMASKVLKDDVFGMKFHMISLLHVSALTAIFLIFQPSFIGRGLAFVVVSALIGLKFWKFYKNEFSV